MKRVFLINESPKFNDFLRACFLNEGFEEIRLFNETATKEFVKGINESSSNKIFLVLRPTALLDLYCLLKSNEELDLRLIILDENNLPELKRLRNYSFAYIDCSNIDCKELSEKIYACIKENDLIVSISSFGYKYEIPSDADLIFDCRNIPNPYWDERLKEKTGLDKEVVSFLNEKDSVKEFLLYLFNYLDYFLKETRKDGRKYISIYFGCTGGQHRSVYFATKTYARYKGEYNCLISHKELKRRK